MSYVEMPSAEVKRRAQAMLEQLSQTRAKMLEEVIDEKIRVSERSWWRKLFNEPVLTREQALELAKETRDYFAMSQYDEIMVIMFANQEEKTKTLLRMAENNDVVFVSSEDYKTMGWR